MDGRAYCTPSQWGIVVEVSPYPDRDPNPNPNPNPNPPGSRPEQGPTDGRRRDLRWPAALDGAHPMCRGGGEGVLARSTADTFRAYAVHTPSPWGDQYVRASRATGRPPRRAIAPVVDYRPMGAGIRRAACTARTPCPRALRLAPCPCHLQPAPAACQVVCLTCGRVSCTTEPFLDLSLSVRARLGLGL